ncbi:MAG: multicopper oxidase domain-containing protein, partial [Rhodoglobus sp.]|nr:multicopper oxidase domain-containing protein [Rhodoglobus sp.]
GVFPLVATAEGKEAAAFALLRTGGGAAPTPMTVLPETYQRVGTAGKLAAAEEVTLPNLPVDRTVRVTLGGGMGRYDWTLNGRRFDASNPLDGARQVRDGENVELIFENTSMMWHPMHLHGHTYQHSAGGPRKDTSIVLPGQSLRVNFVADNPGQWLMHCHNIYHGEAGMMGVLAYLA